MLPALCAVVTLTAPPTLQMPAVFGDNMVLQRGIRAPIFGKARAGQEVEVEFLGKKYRTQADEDGKWLLRLDPLDAGGPYSMVVRADRTEVLRHVTIGEVWVASGQSNMEWRVAWADAPELDVMDADPAIRMFTVIRQSSETPSENVRGSWVPASRQSVFGFSAVGYAFAKQIQRRLGVPVGIIHTSWGGTPAESWTRRETLAKDPVFGATVTNYLASLPSFPERRAQYEQAMIQYGLDVYKRDVENLGYHDGWAEPDANLGMWQPTTVPGSWEAVQGLRIDGAVWYRKTVTIPDSWYGKELRLELGTIDDFDNTYFNGHKVGYIRPDTREANKIKRTYRVFPGLVRRGQNTIAVRVFDQFDEGGFTGMPEDMRLTLADGADPTVVPLNGTWYQRIEKRMEPASEATVNNMPVSPVGPGHPQAPGGLWNGMVAPFVGYGIRGAIWYQGESNAPRAYDYRRLFPLMIRDWRSAWGQGDFPFYYVQLANFRRRREDPSESDWAELREAQLLALREPKTGMAVTIDIGDAGDIHPKNKREVGRRLALHALKNEYGQSVVRQGPVVRTARVQGADVQVFFDSVGARLKTSDGGPVKGFAIAGADRKFVWANARISGSSVVVSSPRVPKPVSVRYGWADNPDVNLINSENLPASPFRTDDWPGVTWPAGTTGSDLGAFMTPPPPPVAKPAVKTVPKPNIRPQTIRQARPHPKRHKTVKRRPVRHRRR